MKKALSLVLTFILLLYPVAEVAVFATPGAVAVEDFAGLPEDDFTESGTKTRYFIDGNRLYSQTDNKTQIEYEDYAFEYIYSCGELVFANAKDTDGNVFDFILGNISEIEFENNEEYADLSAVTSNTNETKIFNYLTGTMGLNTAAACGILANIYMESSFNPTAYGDKIDGQYTSYGICQWHDGRFTNLKNYCSNNGLDYTTVEGQLAYLNYELNSSTYYRSILQYIASCENSASGAYDAGAYWCAEFERPADSANQSIYRGNLARDTFYAEYAGLATSVNMTIEEFIINFLMFFNYILKSS